jgi:hypothetical protein
MATLPLANATRPSYELELKKSGGEQHLPRFRKNSADFFAAGLVQSGVPSSAASSPPAEYRKGSQ